MKRMSILVVILALAVMLTACGTEKAPEETTSAAASTAAVTVPTDATAPAETLALTSWNMSASTWSSPNGATIHISATPNYYTEGQKADFVVRLESDDISSTSCQWDGTSYTASADLNAANGYCYYLVLTAADGTAVEVAVNTPAAPTNAVFIDLEASLESYCSVTVEESSVENDQLTLSAGKVQVKAPVITNAGEAISCQEAVLLLSLDGEELGKEVLTLSQSDTEGLFEAALENIVFDIPEMETDQKVELTLSATLTNGQVLTAFGGNWVAGEEGLMSIVG